MAATQAAFRFPTATPTTADYLVFAQGFKRRLATMASLVTLIAVSVVETPAAIASILAAVVANTTRVAGVKTLHATTASQPLLVADLGKLIIAPNTGAIAVPLPAAASCTGRGYIIKKTTSDAAAVTIDPDASETIDGGANYAAIDAANDCIEIVSDGTKWLIIAKSIA